MRTSRSASSGVGLLGAGALLEAAGVEDGEGTELAPDIEPAALAGLGLDVADLGDAGAEEGVDEGGLAGAAAAHEDEVGRALFEQQGAQVGDLLADVAGERIRDAVEHFLEPADRLGDFEERGFVRSGHGSSSEMAMTYGGGESAARAGDIPGGRCSLQRLLVNRWDWLKEMPACSRICCS